MKIPRLAYSFLASFVILLSTSCETTEACEDNNLGVITLENTRSQGSLNLYVNPVRIGSNTPGDLVLKPGEQGSIDVPAGVHNVLVRLRITSCEGNRCAIQTTTLDEKSIDLPACETVNMIY